MVRIAKKTDPKRIEELKRKIRDTQYVQDAVQKIAQRLSTELLNHRHN